MQYSTKAQKDQDLQGNFSKRLKPTGDTLSVCGWGLTFLMDYRKAVHVHAHHCIGRMVDEEITPELINAAMLLECEIGMHDTKRDVYVAINNLTDSFRHNFSTRHQNALRDLWDDAQALRRSAEESYPTVARRRWGKATQLRLPRLIAKEDIAKVINLTIERKRLFFEGLRLTPIDAPTSDPMKDVRFKNFTPEQVEEHAALAWRFNLTTKTIGNWRKKGPEFFEQQVAKREAKLLPAVVIEKRALPGESPMDTTKRVTWEDKQARKRYEGSRGKAWQVEVSAKLHGVHPRTVYRHLKSGAPFKMESNPKLIELAREGYKLKKGKYLKDTTIRKWKERDQYDANLVKFATLAMIQNVPDPEPHGTAGAACSVTK